jgi:hypothetical protein
MRIKAQIITVIILVLASLKAQTDESGLSFLQVPAYGRAAATMGVFSQVSESPFAIFDSPVGLLNESVKVGFSHNFWFADVTGEALAASVPLWKGSLGFGLNYVRIPGIAIRDIPSDEPLSETEAQYMSAAIGYAYPVFSKLSIGVTLKYLYEHLYTENAGGVAMDIAGHWQIPSGMDLCLSLSNFGKMQVLKEQATNLPTLFKIGIVRPEIFADSPVNFTLGVNLIANVVTEKTSFQVGGELAFTELIKIRTGYERVGTINRTSLGAGLHVGRFEIDYAFIFMPDGLGYPNLISLSYRPEL